MKNHIFDLNEMEEDTNFGLALSHIKDSLPETFYSYLLSVLNEAREDEKLVRKSSHSKETSRHWQKSELENQNVRGLSLLEVKESGFEGIHINLSSLKRTPGSSIQNDSLCSHLPVCKKILARATEGRRTIG